MPVTGRTVMLLLFLAVGALAVTGCSDGASRQRIHLKNLARAEVFKREFDAQVAEGTALPAVEEYLRAKPVNVQRSMGFHDGRDFVKRLMIELAEERSVNWYCGKASVGLMAEFDNERLTGSHVSSWSFDCP